MQERFHVHIRMDCVGGGELTSGHRGHSGDTGVRTQIVSRSKDPHITKPLIAITIKNKKLLLLLTTT